MFALIYQPDASNHVLNVMSSSVYNYEYLNTYRFHATTLLWRYTHRVGSVSCPASLGNYCEPSLEPPLKRDSLPTQGRIL